MIEAVVGAALWAIALSCVFGTVLFAVVTVVVRTSALDATLRHILWLIALGTTALLPVVALTAGIGQHATFAVAARNQHEPDRPSVRRRERAPLLAPAAASAPLSVEPAPSWLRSGARPRPDRTAALAIVILWLTGAGIGVGVVANGMLRVRGLKRRSTPLDTQLAAELPWLTQNGPTEREIYLRLSYEIETPVAVGFRRPTILIPADLTTRGGLRAIEGLILHEHAHLRRRDDWTNLAQRLIERVFWFNPLVWMLGRRIALDREIAADDAVVAATGCPEAYAQTLWQLVREMRMPEHTIVAPGALTTRKQISVRIEALLERRPVGTARRVAAALVTACAASACMLAAAAAAPPITLPAEHVDAHAIATIRSAGAAAHASVGLPAVPVAPVATRGPRALSPTAPLARAAAPAQARPPTTIAFAPLLHRPPAHDIIARPRAAAAHANARIRVAQNSPVLMHSDLSGRDLRGVDWRGRTITNVNLAGADLAGARLDDTHFIDSDLSGADLRGASLRNAVVSSGNISDINLRNALTIGMRVYGVSLSGADLRNLDVRSLISACGGCDMSGAELGGADLHGLHLSGINLSGADLHRVNLTDATLDGVDLSGADLRSADLRGTALTGCRLDGAELRGALRGGTRFVPNPPAVDDN